MKRPSKNRGGRPITTGSWTTPKVTYRLGADEHIELAGAATEGESVSQASKRITFASIRRRKK